MKKSNAVLSVMSLLTLSMALSGCVLTESQNDIGGHLYVKKAFAAMDKDGSSTQLEAGQEYDTVLHMSDQGSDFAIHPNPFTSIDALLPNPKADQLGKVAVAASDSKQAFDVAGDVSESESHTPEAGSESCILGYHTELVCREVEDPAPKPQPGQKPVPPRHHRECNTVTVTDYGHQNYSGTRYIRNRMADLTLTAPGSQDVLATFSGSYEITNTLLDKVMTSPCYR